MDGDNELKPALTIIDVQRGWKDVAATLKSGDQVTVRVTAISWEALGALHLDTDGMSVEKELMNRCLPANLNNLDSVPHGWLSWLDLDSRNLLMRTVREFAYGFSAEKKRAAAIRSISKLFSDRNAKPPSSASDSVSTMPSPGAALSSESSPSVSAESKPTTA